MKEKIRLLLHIKESEGQASFLFSILGFFLAFAAFMGLRLSEALFLRHLGSSYLPLSYFCTAIGAICGAFYLLNALKKKRPDQIFQQLLFFASALYSILFLFLYTFSLHIAFIFIFKVSSYVLFLTLLSSYWSCIDQDCDFLSAKRLYCIFNASLFLGIACAGISLPYAFFSPALSLLGSVFLFAITAFFAKKISYKQKENDEANEALPSIRDFLVHIIQSRFTLSFLSACFCIEILMVLTEYHYMLSLEKLFLQQGLEQEEALSSFIGLLTMKVSLGNLFFGLFIYRRMSQQLGFCSLLLITPLLFFGIYSSWLFLPDALWITILAFIAVEACSYSLDDNNFSILLNGVPKRFKQPCRIILDSLLEPMGMLIAAFCLSYLQINMHLLALLLSGIALGATLYLRSDYPQAIFEEILREATSKGKRSQVSQHIIHAELPERFLQTLDTKL